MRKLALIIVFCLAQIPAWSQFGYGKPEDIREVEQKTLLVVLDSKNEKIVKKLAKKPEKLAEYEKEIEDYNAALKAAFTNEWKFSKKVEFITEEEFEAIKDDKTKKGQYAYFRNKVRRTNYLTTKGEIVPDTYLHQLGLTDQGKPVYEMMYYSIHPNEADLTFIIQQFEQYFKGRLEYKENGKSKKDLKEQMIAKSPIIKEKTLLIDEKYVSKDLKKKISEIYKYNYKITNKEEIDNAILNHNAEYAYIRSIPVAQTTDRKSTGDPQNDLPDFSSRTTFLQYVINAENGETLSYAAPDAFGLPLVSTDNRETTVDDLKKILKHIESN